MSSKTIYHTAKDRTPYTYYIVWSYLGLHYYGRRTAKGCHPSEFWKTYFTSSKLVKEIRLEAEPDIIEVRYIFDCVNKCKQCEVNVLKYNNAARSEKWVNATNGDLNWGVTGKDINKNKAVVKDKDGNTFSIPITDPRYLSGELTPIISNKAVVKDKNNDIFWVNKDDPRYISGEFVGHTKGTFPARNIITGDITLISSDDPRYLSGELVGIAKNRINVKDPKTGKCFSIARDDPRYLSGELVGVMKGRLSDKIWVHNKEGKNFRVTADNVDYISGNLKPGRAKKL